jgi:hypothetical protein
MSRGYIQECVGLNNLLAGHAFGELVAAIDARVVTSRFYSFWNEKSGGADDRRIQYDAWGRV